MKKISALEIRDSFFNFFEEHDHLKISDSSIIPKNDPTLLFINSGMAPLKNFFNGEENPPSPRLCNVQPCIRTIDIDEVGDKHHLTSFQMLGSWSINNYFKENAIKLAFKFLTEYLNIPKEKLYVTVFSGNKGLNLEPDNESKVYWEQVGVEKSHIVECGWDNFWGPTSEIGPCGPCTEVFYDTGSGEENKYVPGSHFDTKERYIEIWNAGVFMQFNKNSDGSYGKLKFNSVDTGAGLERLAMVLNDCESVYDTDLLSPIKNCIKNELKDNNLNERDILILTDHLRTITLILSEKVRPSNEGRGYIPRKLIRKCILIILKAKINKFNFTKILEFIIDMYKNSFTKFELNRDYIISAFEKEYSQFKKVLISGLERLEIIKSQEKNISKENSFELVTTYGLPFDIVKEFASENNLIIDEKGYLEKLEEHKRISRQTNKSEISSNLEDLNFDKTTFLGYEKFETEASVLQVLDCNDDKIGVILDKTTFYAESGGQCADKGDIYNNNFKMEVSDVQKTKNGVIVHFGNIKEGKIKEGDKVITQYNKSERLSIANNHSSVHLLHSALKKLFGKEVNQAGSKVDKERLRFDFNYDGQILIEDVFNIEKLVNSYVRKNVELNIQEMSLEDAMREGATALFQNKYTEKVRVVTFGDISKELCGGTHTSMTGNIGLFVITSVEGIGKGIRRITAVTGNEAIKHIQNHAKLIRDVCETLKTNPDDIISKIKNNSKNNKSNNTSQKLDESNVEVKTNKNGIKYTYIVKDVFDKKLRDEVISFSDKINGIVIFVSGNDKKQILISVSEKITDKYKANVILKSIISDFNGKGGGSARMASGGGLNCTSDDILEKFSTIC